jgi:putative membrane protein insertion efficiency factor
MKSVLILFVRFYQRALSPLIVGIFGPACRFEPSCSQYAILCLQSHGAVRGTLLSAKRLCRCHPFHPGGFDPQPAPLPPPPHAARQ